MEIGVLRKSKVGALGYVEFKRSIWGPVSDFHGRVNTADLL